MAPAAAPDRIVIGVDFGTTFSGVAEAYSGKTIAADDIHVIKTWPSGSNVTSDKVPSEIAYSESATVAEEGDWSFVVPDAFDTATLQASLIGGVAGSSQSTIRWGFQLRPDEPRLRCMKLFLDPCQKLPAFVSKSEMQHLLAESGKDAVAVVGDYMSEIYKHTQEQLTRGYGAAFMRTTDIQWVLTVPAMWSDAAKDATLTAARKSGMGPELTLISEPEAAAVYTLQAIQPNNLKVGDNFVVCDAGGGTVDLISYEIKQIHPLRIEESAEGSGACCGAAMLNAKFEDLIRDKMGARSFATFCRDNSRSWLAALKHFEEFVKRNFDPDTPTAFDITFPGVPDNADIGVEQGFLTISFREVADMFKPIINDISGLVQGQIDKVRSKGKVVAGVVLMMATKDARDRAARVPYEVMQPAHAWTAVVRGAVLRGLQGVEMVLSRKSRRHYGVVVRRPYDPAVHPWSCRVWDDKEGRWKAENQMTWYIKKGEPVSSTEPILFDFYRNFAEGAGRVVSEDLIVCEREVAPAYFRKSPRFPSTVLCSMVINLHSVPAHLWTAYLATDGSIYHRLSYQLGMQIESGGLKFNLQVDGVSYGEVTASFDSD